MGLLTSLATTAIKSGVDYASNKYAADKKYAADVYGADKRMEQVKTEHLNALTRMGQQHDNTINELNVRHKQDMERIKTQGKYGLGAAGIAGAATTAGAYLKYRNKNDDNNRNGGNKGSGGGIIIPQTKSKGQEAWEQFKRDLNDAGKRSTLMNIVPAASLLSSGAATASGFAGILPMLAI